MDTTFNVGFHWDHKRLSDPLELELQWCKLSVVGHLQEHQAAIALNYWDISPDPTLYVYILKVR